MPSTRPINLDKWGITWEEYKELSYFCLQYARKKRDAAALLTLKTSTPAPVTYHKGGKEYGAFLPHAKGATGDPTAATAAKREHLLNDVRMIEQAATGATDAVKGLYGWAIDPRYILMAVTRKSGVQALYANPATRPPLGERQFYTVRRVFFWILHEMKNGDLEPIV